MATHLIDGEFQSDKYPTCPRGKVPLSVGDATAQDLLWEYAQRRRAVDPEFADDLEAALTRAGFPRPKLLSEDRLARIRTAHAPDLDEPGSCMREYPCDVLPLLGHVEALEAERDELQQLFDLQHRREREAIAGWRSEKPGRELTLPDYGKFLLWLLDERDRLIAELKQAAT